MIKKLFITLLAISLIGLMAGDVFADGLPRVSDIKVSTYVKVNSAPGTGQTQVVSAATITPDDRILGFIVSNFDPTASIAVGLYDTTTVALASTSTIFVEAEVLVGDSKAIWFPYPKKVTNQLVILMSQGKCLVTVFYEDVSAAY